MVWQTYHLLIGASLGLVWIASIYLAAQGQPLAKRFLWAWAIGLALVAPMLGNIAELMADNAVGLLLLFLLSLMLFFSNTSQAKVQHAEAEIRRLLDQSNNRMDEERRLIARQIHDEINPKVIVAKLEIQQLAVLLKENFQADAAVQAAQQIVQSIHQRLADIYQDNRAIIKNTRIEMLDSIGLTAALESLVDHYKSVLDQQPRITLVHNLPTRPQLTTSSAIKIYRIIQEALLNAVKYAQASNIRITIDDSKYQFCAVVQDDGLGISTKNPTGIGLIDMRERARSLGGELRIETHPAQGTQVSLTFLHQDSSNHTELPAS